MRPASVAASVALLSVVLLPVVPGGAAQGAPICGVMSVTCQTRVQVTMEVDPAALPPFPEARATVVTVSYMYHASTGVLAEGETPITFEAREVPAGIRVEPLQWVGFVPIRTFEPGAVEEELAFPIRLSCTDGDPSQRTLGFRARAASNGGYHAAETTMRIPARCAPAPSEPGSEPAPEPTERGLSWDAPLTLAAAAGALGLVALPRLRTRRRL